MGNHLTARNLDLERSCKPVLALVYHSNRAAEAEVHCSSHYLPGVEVIDDCGRGNYLVEGEDLSQTTQAVV